LNFKERATLLFWGIYGSNYFLAFNRIEQHFPPLDFTGNGEYFAPHKKKHQREKNGTPYDCIDLFPWEEIEVDI